MGYGSAGGEYVRTGFRGPWVIEYEGHEDDEFTG